MAARGALFGTMDSSTQNNLKATVLTLFLMEEFFISVWLQENFRNQEATNEESSSAASPAHALVL